MDSEFETEYQAWLNGNAGDKRREWFDHPVRGLARQRTCSVSEATSIAGVVAQMSEQDTGTALVTGERGELSGIFSERDLLRRVVAESRDPASTPVKAVMTPEPEVLPAAATVAHALRLFSRVRFRHVPLVDDHGSPVAVLSARQLMGFVSETFPKEVLNAPPVDSRPITKAEGA